MNDDWFNSDPDSCILRNQEGDIVAKYYIRTKLAITDGFQECRVINPGETLVKGHRKQFLPEDRRIDMDL